MSSERSSFRHRTEAALVRAALAAAGVLSDRGRAALGAVAGRAYLAVGRRRRRIGMENLRRALPGAGEDERRRILRRCAESFGRVLLDFLAASRMTREELLGRVRATGVEHFRAALSRGRGVFLLSAHLGNWEVGALAAGLLVEPIASVVRPLDNPILERELRDRRCRFGNRVHAKKSASREILREMRAGRVVAILIDQNVLAREAVFVPFFGRAAATTPSLALLQRKTGAAVVPVFCRPEGPGRYCLEFHPPIVLGDLEVADRETQALTARYTRVTEEAVRKNPDLWLWMHNRWRTRPPGEEA